MAAHETAGLGRAAFDPAVIDAQTIAGLRAGGSLKWAGLPVGHIGAGVAEMDLGVAPAIRLALAAAAVNGEHGYLPADLIGELGAATSDWLAAASGWRVDPETVLPAAGVVAALGHAIELFCPPGGTVIVPTPAYSPFFAVPERLGRRVAAVPLLPGPPRPDSAEPAHAPAGPALDLDGIDAAFAAGASMLLLCSPHNPSGRVFPAGQLRALSAIVARHGGVVFSDEMHAPLLYPGQRHTPYAGVGALAAVHTITALSTSKAWNTSGLRCGQVQIGDPALRQRWLDECGRSLYDASRLGVVAAIAAYRDGGDWLAGAMRHLERNLALVTGFFADELPDAGFRPPQAGYLAWANLAAVGAGPRPAAALAQSAGVRLSDGADFGTAGQGWARLNFALPRPVLEEALQRIALALRPRRDAAPAPADGNAATPDLDTKRAAA